MSSKRGKTLVDCFAEIEDPRIDRHKKYSLLEVITLVVCGGICGCESWEDFVLFGRYKIEFLRKILPYKAGIPSKSTIHRVMGVIAPEAFESCFYEWVKDISQSMGEVIAIDGKTCRRSFDRRRGQSPLHMVSAYGVKRGLVLAAERVDEKSNEITAIPKILKMLYLKGAIITIDAMGCQKEIAEEIVEGKGDYILGLKGNHGVLHEEVGEFFGDEQLRAGMDYAESVDKGHGRIDIRRCWASEDIGWCESVVQWANLRSVVMVESERQVGEQTQTERRYYITSLTAQAEQLNKYIRGHWAIENSLHWTLDMTFREDESRMRDKIIAQNMALLRRLTFNLIKQYKQGQQTRSSVKALRKQAGWDNVTLQAMLLQEF